MTETINQVKNNALNNNKLIQSYNAFNAPIQGVTSGTTEAPTTPEAPVELTDLQKSIKKQVEEDNLAKNDTSKFNYTE